MTEDWAVASFLLNPASARTFPWLSEVAQNYEQFKFLGLAFGFRSLTANALAATGDPSMGSVTCFTQYDLYDEYVTSKLVANNQMFATSCKPSENMLHPVECDPEQTPTAPLYTGVNEPLREDYPIPRPEQLGGFRDNRLNYLGVTSIGMQGGPSGSTYKAGELWVTYDVMLYKPSIKHGDNPIGGPQESVISRVLRTDRELARLPRCERGLTEPPLPRPPVLQRESTRNSDTSFVRV
jgi:hypothetical protein